MKPQQPADFLVPEFTEATTDDVEFAVGLLLLLTGVMLLVAAPLL